MFAPQVRCSGPGLERAKVGEKGEFFVDCTNAGPADLTIEIISDSGTEAEVHIQDNGDGTYTITYIPLYPGSYTLTIRYGGQDVPNFPARLTVEPAVDASGVHVFGPGVEGKGREKPAAFRRLRVKISSGLKRFVSRLQVFSARPPPTSPWTLAL